MKKETHEFIDFIIISVVFIIACILQDWMWFISLALYLMYLKITDRQINLNIIHTIEDKRMKKDAQKRVFDKLQKDLSMRAKCRKAALGRKRDKNGMFLKNNK